MTIGARLKMIRKSKELKLIEVGKIFDITAQTLSRYENDQRTPDNDFLEAFGKYFNLSGNWLLYNEPPIYKTDIQDRDIKESFLELSNLISSKDVHDIDIPTELDFSQKITSDNPENYLLLIKYMLKYPIIRKGIFQFFYLLLKPLIDNHSEHYDDS
ncbi:MAG: helix-turn-helix transcriptional regulator [Candidatus Aminicenantes bacterium]|jgi:transcriptional regulator with XRE-family HTH domain